MTDAGRQALGRRTVLLVWLAAATPAAASPPAHAVAVADYDIEVRLDPEAKTLDGRERIVWHNPSTDRVGELWLHLYLNAFRNSESTFMRESGGRLRGQRMPPDGWGWTDVSSIRRADGADLTKGLRFEHPDDDNALDRTAVRVALPEPVPPGGSLALDVAWKAKLPWAFARSGYVRDYFLVGQWFPKLAVYEPAGLRGRARGGWNCHQYHAESEFYADFGSYRVAITLPARFVVGATGRRLARHPNPDGSVTHLYQQADVIDFAWAAAPDFVELHRTFSAEKDVGPDDYAAAARDTGRSAAELRLGDVEVTLLLQPSHLPQLERHFAAAKAAIKWFGLWYGRYPYPTLTIVDPAPGADGSGGMEYPTFFAAGTRALYNRWPFDRIDEPELVVIHEFGHQYWQGMVATNEFEEPWLDEGLDEYSTGKVFERAYGPWAVRLGPFRAGELELARIWNDDGAFDRIRTSSWGFSPGNYYFTTYNRSELMLRTLERLAGEDTLTRALRAYHERWRFGHPSSDDFFATPGLEPWRTFFAQTVESPGLVDYEVASVQSEPVKRPQGVLEPSGGATPAREALSWRSTVLVRRRGEVVLPVDLELVYESGRRSRIALRDEDGGVWSGRWQLVERVGPERLLSATVDPDDRLVLDVNRLNNARRTRGDGGAADRWGTLLAFWVEQALAVIGL